MRTRNAPLASAIPRASQPLTDKAHQASAHRIRNGTRLTASSKVLRTSFGSRYLDRIWTQLLAGTGEAAASGRASVTGACRIRRGRSASPCAAAHRRAGCARLTCLHFPTRSKEILREFRNVIADVALPHRPRLAFIQRRGQRIGGVGGAAGHLFQHRMAAERHMRFGIAALVDQRQTARRGRPPPASRRGSSGGRFRRWPSSGPAGRRPMRHSRRRR